MSSLISGAGRLAIPVQVTTPCHRDLRYLPTPLRTLDSTTRVKILRYTPGLTARAVVPSAFPDARRGFVSDPVNPMSFILG